METLKVGVREFRANLPQFLLKTSCPIAVTRHGETVGYFIPSKDSQADKELFALREAARKLDALLAERDFTEEEIVAEFIQLRSENKKNDP
jgi:hypothetical protein